jgi:GrpB-like predicted nucleotidyltransferase (UPF0157 family)
MDEKLKKRIAELVKEEISIVPYDKGWIKMFNDEAGYLKEILPSEIVKRIEHFGSTAVKGLSAKPIIDILVEVSSSEETKKLIVPLLEAKGYEQFWRPSFGDDGPPYYHWFIKRNSKGYRTHHIHMVEAGSELWDRLFFRDYLRQFPEERKRYDELKRKLSNEYPADRIKYTEEKSSFIISITKKAKKYYESGSVL